MFHRSVLWFWLVLSSITLVAVAGHTPWQGSSSATYSDPPTCPWLKPQKSFCINYAEMVSYSFTMWWHNPLNSLIWILSCRPLTFCFIHTFIHSGNIEQLTCARHQRYNKEEWSSPCLSVEPWLPVEVPWLLPMGSREKLSDPGLAKPCFNKVASIFISYFGTLYKILLKNGIHFLASGTQ